MLQKIQPLALVDDMIRQDDQTHVLLLVQYCDLEDQSFVEELFQYCPELINHRD
jgi:hypothetical protein